ncbi:MAG: cytochrome c [Dehalococcoidales bacterium]|nr:cytochrome c [Dehalococcoidales bacterium]
MTHRITPIILVITNLLLLACQGQATPPANAPRGDITTVPDGASLYSANCASCHGESRQGVYGSGGALTPDSLGVRSDAAVKETIVEGIPYTNMPAWKTRLSPEEIDALLQFIKYTAP